MLLNAGALGLLFKAVSLNKPGHRELLRFSTVKLKLLCCRNFLEISLKHTETKYTLSPLASCCQGPPRLTGNYRYLCCISKKNLVNFFQLLKRSKMTLHCKKSVVWFFFGFFFFFFFFFTKVYKSQRLLSQIMWLYVDSIPEWHTYFTQLK